MQSYHWNWGIFLQESVTGEGTYLDWLLVGVRWTVTLSLTAWILALIIGSVVGIARTAPSKWLSLAATAYVEMLRNVPLLVQLFFWYFVLPDLLPGNLGTWFKQLHPLIQQFAAALLCLALFTGARVAEQVRSGIESISKGQKQAALALGLTLPQTYRYVLLPLGYRIILPPLTSEFMNIFKNSAVATTIGFLELSSQAQRLVDFTAQPYESFIAATLCYALINVTIMLSMRMLEKRLRVPGLISNG